MEPVNRELQLRSDDAKHVVKPSKPKENLDNVTIHKPKGQTTHKGQTAHSSKMSNRDKKAKESVFGSKRPNRPRKSNNRRKQGHKNQAAAVPPKYKAIGAGVAGVLVVGVGVAAVAGHHSDHNSTQEAASQTDNELHHKPTLKFDTSSNKKHSHHHKSSSKKDDKGDSLSALLNDTNKGKDKDTKSDNNMDGLLGNVSQSGLKKLAAAADESQKAADSLGSSNKNNGSSNKAPQPQPISNAKATNNTPKVDLNNANNTAKPSTPTAPVTPSNGNNGNVKPATPSGGNNNGNTTPSKPEGGNTTPTNPNKGNDSKPTTPDHGNSGGNQPANPDHGNNNDNKSSTPTHGNDNQPTGPNENTHGDQPSDPNKDTHGDQPAGPNKDNQGDQPTTPDNPATDVQTVPAAQAGVGQTVELAENVQISGPNGFEQKFEPYKNENQQMGIHFDSAGTYEAHMTVDLANGQSAMFNKTINVSSNGTLSDPDTTTQITQHLEANPITVKAGTTVNPLDSVQLTNADGKAMTLQSTSGVQLQDPGKYNMQWTIGNTQFTKVVTVTQ